MNIARENDTQATGPLLHPAGEGAAAPGPQGAVSAADREIVSAVIYKPADAYDVAALIRNCPHGGSAVGVLRNTRHRLVAGPR